MDGKKLYILTYDHGGFVLWGDKVRDRLDSALQWLDKYPKFKVGLDFEAFTFDEMERVAPDINEKIAKSLEKYKGRFALGSSTYGQPLSLFVSDESNVRQLTYAIRSNLRHFGQTPSVYAISEFALNHQTPQLLRLCGYQGAIMRTHVMNYGYQRSYDKAYGLWVGKDGTGIPAVPSYDDEGVGFTNTTLDNWILTRWPGESQYSLEDFVERFGKYEPLLASRYDDLTLRKEELVAHAQEVDDYTFVLLEELPELFGEPTERLEADDNDFHGHMPWGYCGNEIFNGIRAAENSAAAAERLNALSVILGGKAEDEKLEAAWKNVLIAQHHDVTICGLLDEAHRFIPDSLKNSGDVRNGSMDRICAAMAGREDGVVVWNGASFPVAQWIRVETDRYTAAFDGDKPLPAEAAEGALRVFVSVPPMTAKRVRLAADAADESSAAFAWDADAGILSTPDYTVFVSAKGVCRIEDRRSGRRIVDNGEGKLFRGWIDGVDEVSDSVWTVQVNAHSAKASCTGRIGSIPYRFGMTVREGCRAIECAVEFDVNGQKVGRTGVTKGIHSDYVVNGQVHEDKLRLVLDLNLDKSRRMVRDLPFAIADWDGQLDEPEDFWYEGSKVLVDHRVSPEKSFAGVTYLQGVNWLCMRDDRGGLAVLNRGCMGSAVAGNCLNIPLVYANDYYNGTRMLNGTFRDEFALLPFESGFTDLDVHREALAYELPLEARFTAKGDGSIDAVTAATLTQTGDSVLLTALYPEDGALYARFCNFSDQPAEAVFDLCGKPLEITDLLGNKLADADGGRLAFHPWEIVTVRTAL